MKTRKVMELTDCGVHIAIVKEEGKANPYRVMAKYYDAGWHRKTLGTYPDLYNCMVRITNGISGFPGAKV